MGITWTSGKSSTRHRSAPQSWPPVEHCRVSAFPLLDATFSRTRVKSTDAESDGSCAQGEHLVLTQVETVYSHLSNVDSACHEGGYVFRCPATVANCHDAVSSAVSESTRVDMRHAADAALQPPPMELLTSAYIRRYAYLLSHVCSPRRCVILRGRFILGKAGLQRMDCAKVARPCKALVCFK